MGEYDKTGNHPLLNVVVAIVVVVAIIGGYVWATYTGPVHTGEVLSMSAYPIHRELSTGSGLGGLSGGPNVYDEVIVIVNVQVKSTTKLPLFLQDAFADVTLANGEVQESRSAGGEDAKKVFVAYPELAGQKQPPLPLGITMTPGQVVAGQLIFHFPISKQDWDGRRAFDLDVRFINQKSLVLHAMGS
ncbi:MAG TPA: hypothetical protein VHX37_14865 [Acidobacteriaceae bacterium]|jgi:hypothetical protein|nr:hypothetical protein [Acidobacteriaceae bacterium]